MADNWDENNFMSGRADIFQSKYLKKWKLLKITLIILKDDKIITVEDNICYVDNDFFIVLTNFIYSIFNVNFYFSLI